MKISVIIPVYNVEKYIERCLQSIFSQTYQNFEILVVNDASPDNSMKIVKKYAEQDSRIKIFENSENMGPMWNRKIGYKNATGDYLMFCDSDDYLPENALELLCNKIMEENADIVAGAMQTVSEHSSVVKKFKLSYGTDRISIYKSLLKDEMLHSLCGKIYKRSLFDNYEYDCFEHQNYGEDAILFYQIVNNITKMTVIDDVVYCYRKNTESATYSKITEERKKRTLIPLAYIYSFLSKIQEVPVNEINKSVVKRLLHLKFRSYSKKTILKYSTLDIQSLFGWKKLSSCYHGLKLFTVWFVLNYLKLNIKYR